MLETGKAPNVVQRKKHCIQWCRRKHKMYFKKGEQIPSIQWFMTILQNNFTCKMAWWMGGGCRVRVDVEDHSPSLQMTGTGA